MGDDTPQSLDEYRLREVERKVDGLQDHQVSREWLEERIGRLVDSIDVLRDRVDTMMAADKQRRMAVYAALVTGAVSLVSALVIAALTTGAMGS